MNYREDKAEMAGTPIDDGVLHFASSPALP
jgi:hypothetical protein